MKWLSADKDDDTDLATQLKSAAIVAGVGDIHSCTMSGLMPPVVKLDDGSRRLHNDDQAWSWESWLDYWQIIYNEKVERKQPVVVIFNAEIADINKHSPAEQVVHDEATAIDIAIETITPALDVGDIFFVTRGTEAHSGKLSSLDEIVAQRIGAQKNRARGTWSWYNLFLEVAGVTFDVGHHPGHGHMRPWTRGGGANRLAMSIVNAYHDAGETPPQITLRGHNHKYEDSGRNFSTLAVINHSWKTSDSFGYRIGAGRHTLPIGGQVFYCKNGRYLHDDIRYAQNGSELGIWYPDDLNLVDEPDYQE